MLHTYSDIKRYDLDPVFLFKTAKQVITDLEWRIQQGTETDLVTFVPRVNGHPQAFFEVTVHRGYMVLSCETDDFHIGIIENEMILERFVKALNQHIADAPGDQRKSIKETYNLSFR